MFPIRRRRRTLSPDRGAGGADLAAPENPEYQAVLSDKVEFLDINRDNNVLTLNFNQEYMNMKASREILCRAALAKTFTQVEGVDYIQH